MSDSKDKPNNVKTYSFDPQELNYLVGRQQILNLTAIINNDTKIAMDNYILTIVLPRLGKDVNKFDVTYNVVKNELYLVDKIILPNNGQPTIEVPSK